MHLSGQVLQNKIMSKSKVSLEFCGFSILVIL